MSERHLATGFALALTTVLLGAAATGAPRTSTALKSPARRAPPAPALVPAPALAPLGPADRDQPTPEASPLHTRFAITFNPLPLIIGRYGANGEVLLAPHHAVVASVYVQTFSKQMLHVPLPSVDAGQGPASRLGGELGYRFYTGRDGPSGLFIGPSAVAVPIA